MSVRPRREVGRAHGADKRGVAVAAGRGPGARDRGVRVRAPAPRPRARVRAHHDACAARRRRRRRARRGRVRVPRGRHDAARDPAAAAARGRVDAGRLLGASRDARSVARPAGVGRGAAVSPVGVRVGGARPRAAPGRPPAARRARPRAAAGALRQPLGLGQEPSIAPLRRRLERSPGVRFKLDAEAAWPAALVAEVAETGAVDTIDFKGQYGLEVKDPGALAALYDRIPEAFPDAYLEDPHDLPGVAPRLADHLERVSYDAPIHRAGDIGKTPLAGRVVNVKPTRIGSLPDLFEVYARCAREGRPMYGGGMGELGVGRGQIELLASLFHPDGPNDVAPSAYNEDDPKGDLAPSPLPPSPGSTGFRWAI